MIIIGITGSIGMGKSTISSMLRKLKIPVFDSDKEVKNILENNNKVKNKIYVTWPDVISFDGKKNKVNKVLLSEKIFSNNNYTKILEKIIHPLVKIQRNNFIKNHKDFPIIALDIPLLYETKTEKICDYVFLVYTNEKKQKERVLSRPNMTATKFYNIKKRQWTNEKKKKKNPYLVVTSYGKTISFILVVVYLIIITFKRKF